MTTRNPDIEKILDAINRDYGGDLDELLGGTDWRDGLRPHLESAWNYGYTVAMGDSLRFAGAAYGKALETAWPHDPHDDDPDREENPTMTHVAGEEGVDFSWARPGAARLTAAGKRFAMRYLSWGASPGQPTYPNGKVLTKPEAESYLAADIAVGLNWEFAAKDALDGYNGGINDGNEAVRQAKALGAPTGLVIYFSADWDVTVVQMPIVKVYWAAAASRCNAAGYKFGVYGGLRAVTAALDLGYHAWQTYAWSRGIWDSRAHIRQYSNGHNLPGTTGGDYDWCRLMRLDAGLWGLTTTTTAPAPAPDELTGGMIL